MKNKKPKNRRPASDRFPGVLKATDFRDSTANHWPDDSLVSTRQPMQAKDICLDSLVPLLDTVDMAEGDDNFKTIPVGPWSITGKFNPIDRDNYIAKLKDMKIVKSEQVLVYYYRRGTRYYFRNSLKNIFLTVDVGKVIDISRGHEIIFTFDPADPNFKAPKK